MNFVKPYLTVIKSKPTVTVEFELVKPHGVLVDGGFVAVWDPEKNLWVKDIYRLVEMIDQEILDFAKTRGISSVKLVKNFNNGLFTKLENFLKALPTSPEVDLLDQTVTMLGDETTDMDYKTRRLPYDFEDGTPEAWNKIVETLLSKEDKEKLEYVLGSVFAKRTDFDKMVVLYGPPGLGKSTILNLVASLFEGYVAVFDGAGLVSNNPSSFATAAFAKNPLVGIQHDADLRKVGTNSILNSIISHEPILINEKYKPARAREIRATLFMATNDPITITSKNSGLLRRVLDIELTGKTLPVRKFNSLMKRIPLERGRIAQQCLNIYTTLGPARYFDYRATKMLRRSNFLYNFLMENILDFSKDVSLARAYLMYKEYATDSNITRILPRYKFREELAAYLVYDSEKKIFSGFKEEKKSEPEEPSGWIFLEENGERSTLEKEFGDAKAQYATDLGFPKLSWDEVETTLSDIDPTRLHYFIPDKTKFIMLDFDIRNKQGEKDLELNLAAANKFPPTYVETSKSNAGLHLYYYTDVDTDILANSFGEFVEIKTFRGNAAIRRILTKHNNLPIAVFNGFPLKEKKKMNVSELADERHIRNLVMKGLKREVHPNTTPSFNFIKMVLDEAYNQKLSYDISDLAPRIISFAASSTHNAARLLREANNLPYKSEDKLKSSAEKEITEDELVFFDIEVFPNLFLVVYKYAGEDKEPVVLVNPGPEEIEQLIKLPLVGFNNRRFDNHLLYAALIGKNDPKDIYEQTKLMTGGSRRGFYGAAYDISYADVYDFLAVKTSLKKLEIELGLVHIEQPHNWDEPIPEDKIPEIIRYCINDVIATEAVFNAKHGDFMARKILARMSGLTPNHTTRQHVARILFGDEKEPSKKFIYTDLRTLFPEYTFTNGVSKLRDVEVGEGGYVYAEPGYYENVVSYDISSMHPTSLIEMNYFGPYTKKYADLKSARVALKHGDIAAAKHYIPDIEQYISSEDELKALVNALKIVLNSVYGFTAAKFPNKFRHPKNKDNIVAKRGALFMAELQHQLEERGIQVVHIKTDSIKLSNPTKEATDFIYEFGRYYGYDFEVEAVYDRFVLVNDAVYVAYSNGRFVATGAEFKNPVVLKTLNHEDISISDLAETKAVKSPSYIEMEFENGRRFVGRVGAFVAAKNGGTLWRIKDGKKYALAGTKGRKFVELAEYKLDPARFELDLDYYDEIKRKAFDHISRYVDVKIFLGGR